MNKKIKEAGFKESKFNTGDVIINYVAGQKHGPPLVLIPGQTLPWQSYQRVLPGLARRFTVYAVDVRGHGKSGWTPGAYTYQNIGKDFTCFLRDVVGEPAIVSGNSSGGVIAVWLAANAPEFVRGIIAEDPPLFSSEWSRLQKCFVYLVLKRCVETIGSSRGRDLGSFFADFAVPAKTGKKVMRMPRVVSKLISYFIRLYQAGNINKPVDLPFLPLNVRIFIKGLSEYDPGFSKAFLDNSMHVDFDHADALSRINCPVLLIRANWFCHEHLGLVGAMDDNDVEKVKSLVKNLQYTVINSGHVIHIEKPQRFISEVQRFYKGLI